MLSEPRQGRRVRRRVVLRRAVVAVGQDQEPLRLGSAGVECAAQRDRDGLVRLGMDEQERAPGQMLDGPAEVGGGKARTQGSGVQPDTRLAGRADPGWIGQALAEQRRIGGTDGDDGADARIVGRRFKHEPTTHTRPAQPEGPGPYLGPSREGVESAEEVVHLAAVERAGALAVATEVGDQHYVAVCSEERREVGVVLLAAAEAVANDDAGRRAARWQIEVRGQAAAVTVEPERRRHSRALVRPDCNTASGRARRQRSTIGGDSDGARPGGGAPVHACAGAVGQGRSEAMPHLGPWELGLILAIVVIIFGVGKLPELGGALGRGIREFRRGASGDEAERPAERAAEQERKA